MQNKIHGMTNVSKALCVIDGATNKVGVAKSALCAELCGNRELANMLRLLSDNWSRWGHLDGRAQLDVIHELIG